MIVYKNPTLDAVGKVVSFDYSDDYSGDCAYGGSGSTTTNQTVPTGPYTPQIPYVQGLFQEAANLYNQGPPQAFNGVNGQLTADINPNLAQSQQGIGQMAQSNMQGNQNIQGFLSQLGMNPSFAQQFGQAQAPGINYGIQQQLNAGNNQLTQSAQNQQGNVQGALDTVFSQTPQNIQVNGTQGGNTNISGALGQQLQGGGGQNPYLEQLVQGATDAQTTAFERNIIPNIGRDAVGAGQFGGSRQGIAEGIAAGDLQRSIGNTAANIYGNAFNTQANLQGQAVQNVLNSQNQNQAAQLDAARINNQNNQQFIQSLLQGTGQVNSNLGQGLGLGFDAIGTGTSQAGNLFQGGNQFGLQQTLGALGSIPAFQNSSLTQLGGQNQLGLQQYGLDQNSIDALSQQYYYNQNSPFNLLSQYQQYISGPYGSSVNPGSQFYGQAPIGQNSGNFNPFIPYFTQPYGV